MIKLFNFVAWLTICTSLAIIALFIFWILWPYNPIVFKDAVFPISQKTINAGQVIHYSTDYCKNMDIAAIVTREFRNDLIFVTPSTISNRQLGCHVVNIAVFIPAELPPGTYIMRQRYEYSVNPIRKIIIVRDTEPFTVINATESAEKK